MAGARPKYSVLFVLFLVSGIELTTRAGQVATYATELNPRPTKTFL